MLLALSLATWLALYAYAIPQAQSAVTMAGVPTLTITTSVASPTDPLSALVPSQAVLPPAQPWCMGQIFCPGALLQTVSLAQVYTDEKTIVDKPTRIPSQRVLADFAAFNLSHVTEGDIVHFEDDDFLGEGLELEGAVLTGFNANPPFLNNVTDPLIRAFAGTVNGYWPQLARAVNQSALCSIYPDDGPCQSTFIPLNHTFVVPGGRYREQYYWDSYWIVQGLLQSELYDTVNSTLQNFMDEIEKFGFIPNGGRAYYLNRSQPPMFVHMLSDYVITTGDASILGRGLRNAEAELAWWANRTIQVTSPYSGQTYSMARYAVTNSAPRPESYLDDYQAVHDPGLPSLNDAEAAELYSQFASGAETGWDFSSRFLRVLQPGNPGLRSMNVRNTIPVCLNSILYKAHVLLADLCGDSNTTAATNHLRTAAGIRAGILDLMWDSSKLGFYDFNLTSNSRNSIFTPATFYPAWSGIIPDDVLTSQENAFGYFASVNMVLNKYNGTFPANFVDWVKQQWDAPNAWAPHQHIIIRALETLPSNLTTNTLPTPRSGQSTYDLVPAGQLNFTEAQLPGQPYHDNPSVNVTATGPGSDINTLNGTVVNGGNATASEGWAATLIRELANRYVSSVLCSWHATGGSIPGMLPRLSPGQLNVTNSVNNTGNMYERFSNLNVDSVGFDQAYDVQVGFGWTNGVLLWAAANYGGLLVAPVCPTLVADAATRDGSNGAVGLTSSAGAMVVTFASIVTSLLL